MKFHDVTLAEVMEREDLLQQVDHGPSLAPDQRARLCYLLKRAVNLPPKKPPSAA